MLIKTFSKADNLYVSVQSTKIKTILWDKDPEIKLEDDSYFIVPEEHAAELEESIARLNRPSLVTAKLV